jgi:hypothetical protein
MKKISQLSIFCVLSVMFSVQAARREEFVGSSWRLPEFLALAKNKPEVLLNTAESYFDSSRMKRARIEPAMAEDWNDRSALLSSLASLWVNHSKHKEIASIKKRAKVVLEKALFDDPALLVRDAAVESVREILRSSPTLASEWKSSLESAFLDERNILKGEGLFIRETILSVMYEAGLKPSKSVVKSAKQDLNTQVRSLLEQWGSSSNFQAMSL